ncbi:MAG: hypothetical protein ACE5EK_11420, partial [Nitrospinales bacterium]
MSASARKNNVWHGSCCKCNNKEIENLTHTAKAKRSWEILKLPGRQGQNENDSEIKIWFGGFSN